MDRRGTLVAIIEDDAAHGRAVARLLAAEGFVTAVFSSAEAYLRSGVQQEPQCLVVDVNLPGMSGIDLTNRLSAAGQAPPIILTSALRDRVPPNHAGSLGAIRFLAKPIDPDALLDAVSSMAPGERLYSRADTDASDVPHKP